MPKMYEIESLAESYGLKASKDRSGIHIWDPKTREHRKAKNLTEAQSIIQSLARELGLPKLFRTVVGDLRHRVIRLAYENPELRGKLLPLLKSG